VLGYGLRRKIAVASIVAMRPDILILDEPTAGLDARSTAELVEVVEALHGDGHTIVVITHDMRLVAEHCVETVVLNEGRVLASGPTRDVLCSREVLDAAQLAAPPILRVSQGLRPLGLRGDSLTVSEFVQDVASLSEAWAT